ncbi:HEAT repeat domain-containing protein [Lyngbya aestuarii]|uniref:HEAT repeat domain-containing protein n=1 Tax=Lyngbya aestuarii TaxID=118322 RepID=UPI00403D8736
MEIAQIETLLQNPDSQERLRALTALRNYDSEVAVPLLLTKLQDPEFLIRSFAATGLGKKQNPESFAALLNLVKSDRDPNVRAEAANSLSLYGEVAVSHLVTVFRQDDHWLVRGSIIAALVEMQFPEALFEVCVCAVAGEDPTVRSAGIDGFGLLANSLKKSQALEQLLMLKNDEQWSIRLDVVRAIKKFEDPQAKAALSDLMQDEDHRVVAAVLETSL